MVPPYHDDSGIEGAEDDDEIEDAVFDQVVNRPALQFERHDFEKEDGGGQGRQQQLMRPAYLEDIPKKAMRQFAESGSGRPSILSIVQGRVESWPPRSMRYRAKFNRARGLARSASG